MCDSIHPRPGRVVAGKYQLEGLLGEGAMGTVWRATHLFLRQEVAVKLILPELADSEAARLRFDAEAKAAAALRSRFVVQIFDSGITDDGVPYLVMEYLTGESLEARVDREGPLPLEQAVRVIGQVARGLARAHAQGIVHRDLKPANVYLAQTEDGEEVAKILDFGIAKVQRGGTSISATATGAVVGTPLFMSPEQARGSKEVDPRSDLYSLGMVAYWALTGRYAFGGEALGELIIAICTHPLPSLVAARPGLPAALDPWFARACAREPGARFASADALVDALVEASAVDPGLLLASGVLQRARGEERPAHPAAAGQSRAEVQLTSGVAVAGTLAIGGTNTGVVQATAAPRRQGPPWALMAVGLVLFVGVVGGVAFFLVTSLRQGAHPVAAVEPLAEPAIAAASSAPVAGSPLAAPTVAPAESAVEATAAPPLASASAVGPAAPPWRPVAAGVVAPASRPSALPPVASTVPARPGPPSGDRPQPKAPADIDIGF
ncbi:MAG TPA: protein kinase [Polyangiaceae bacterium]|nr:protein kinase [Polyangiaceae bacterium]